MPPLSEQVRELEARCESHKQRADGNWDAAQDLHQRLAAAESRLAQAQREAFVAGATWDYSERLGGQLPEPEAARRYPAVPEGGERNDVKIDPACPAQRKGDADCICPSDRPTPTPERLDLLVEATEREGVEFVRITPADARRIVSLAAQDGGSDA